MDSKHDLAVELLVGLIAPRTHAAKARDREVGWRRGDPGDSRGRRRFRRLRQRRPRTPLRRIGQPPRNPHPCNRIRTGAAVAEYRHDHDHDAGPSEYPWDYTSTRYIHDDHLGSAALVTDQTGAELERIGYDPWGRARDAQDWNQYLADDATDDLPIGYTGHQPYLESGLINMRGRMYDPQLGRFMSVDPVVAGVLDGQAWNNYAYVKNRPLSLVDPTGLVPEGENDSSSGWGENREWSEDFGGWCDEYSDGTCTRVISVETAAASTDIPQNGGPGGSYWGNGDGSGIGMRGWGDVMQEGLALKAKHQFQEELAFQRAMGRTCTANGLCTLPGDDTTKQGLPAQALLNTLDTFAPIVSFWALVVIDVIADALDDGEDDITLDDIKSGNVEIAMDRGVPKIRGVGMAAGGGAKSAKARPAHARSPAPEHGTFHVDPRGNTLPTPPGGKVTGSPDGRFLQARDAAGNPTGARVDGPHRPAGHPDPRAQQPHGHVPGVTNPDGTPWLPIK